MAMNSLDSDGAYNSQTRETYTTQRLFRHRSHGGLDSQWQSEFLEGAPLSNVGKKIERTHTGRDLQRTIGVQHDQEKMQQYFLLPAYVVAETGRAILSFVAGRFRRSYLPLSSLSGELEFLRHCQSGTALTNERWGSVSNPSLLACSSEALKLTIALFSSTTGSRESRDTSTPTARSKRSSMAA